MVNKVPVDGVTQSIVSVALDNIDWQVAYAPMCEDTQETSRRIRLIDMVADRLIGDSDSVAGSSRRKGILEQMHDVTVAEAKILKTNAVVDFRARILGQFLYETLNTIITSGLGLHEVVLMKMKNDAYLQPETQQPQLAFEDAVSLADAAIPAGEGQHDTDTGTPTRTLSDCMPHVIHPESVRRIVFGEGYLHQVIAAKGKELYFYGTKPSYDPVTGLPEFSMAFGKDNRRKLEEQLEDYFYPSMDLFSDGVRVTRRATEKQTPQAWQWRNARVGGYGLSLPMVNFHACLASSDTADDPLYSRFAENGVLATFTFTGRGSTNPRYRTALKRNVESVVMRAVEFAEKLHADLMRE